MSLMLCTMYFLKNIQADVDNSGTIDYGEFIAAMMHLNRIDKDDCLVKAFSYFDKDGSGYITKDELQKVFEEFGVEVSCLQEMLQEVDQNKVSLCLNRTLSNHKPSIKKEHELIL